MNKHDPRFGYDAREVIEATRAGESNLVYGRGRQVEVRRNVTGALFIIVGPVHGQDNVSEGVRIIESIGGGA